MFKLIKINAETLETKDLQESKDVVKVIKAFDLLKLKDLEVLSLWVKRKNGWEFQQYRAGKLLKTKDLRENLDKFLLDIAMTGLSEDDTQV